MAQQDFGKWVKDLCLYFERKQPAPQTLDLWWEELKTIPPEFYPAITTYLYDMPAWPKNFPSTVLTLLGHIKPKDRSDDHEAHYAPWKYADNDCTTCKGEGFTRKKAVAYNRAHTESMNLSARVICTCVEPKMYRF